MKVCPHCQMEKPKSEYVVGKYRDDLTERYEDLEADCCKDCLVELEKEILKEKFK